MFRDSLNCGNFLRVEDVLIVFQNHCKAGVPHELCNRPDVCTCGDSFGSKGMSQIVGTYLS